MRTVRAGEEIVRRDPFVVRVLGGDAGVDEALALLDRCEAEVGAPLVDEAERLRLQRLADGERIAPPHWHPILARHDGEPAGYAGITLPTSGAEVDLVPDSDGSLAALVDGVGEIVRRHGAEGVRVWLRAASDEHAEAARAVGLTPDRELLVLGRELYDPVGLPDPPGGVEVRTYRGAEDDEGIVSVLRDAYAGTPDADWDVAALRERRDRPWFRSEDLLVAEGWHGDIVGIHWTKRRGDGTGEVHNLAIATEAQGLGLGRALLREGLRHLTSVGCTEAILWVDRDNRSAVSLYRSEGFVERWRDRAFTRSPG